MQKKNHYMLLLVFFFTLSLGVFALAKWSFFTPVQAIGEIALRPIQNMVFSTFWITSAATNNPEISKLQAENDSLRAQLATLKSVNKENADLRSQLKNTPITKEKLLPAHIIGMRSFIPGFSTPTEVTLDVGKKEGVTEDMAVIVQDMLVGKITKTSAHISQLRLITSTQSTTTAKTLENDTLGVIKGSGDSLFLDNVVLSDKLTVGDTVITAGEVNSEGLGFPPGLIIGKITSLDKRPSALFQTAEVKSSLNIIKQHTVFVVLP